jgi:predicted MFS family arabinose efflux permease
MNISPKSNRIFTSYQVFMIVILAFLQFTVVLDFMVLSPLGAVLLDELSMNTSQFGIVVSAYAFSAGVAAILAAGFADKFDRKKMLLFFYIGFLVGTVFCALAYSYHTLLLARIITGLFGGVMSAISFAIISDIFLAQTRGRVMGFVQMAFSASQVLGIPAGLLLANHYGWHSPFWFIAIIGLIVGIVLVIFMKPVREHLLIKSDNNAFQHLTNTLFKPNYLLAFATTTLLTTGGFMIMPFASAFTTGNLGVSIEDLPLVYVVTGIFSILVGPLIGKYSDKIGKYKIFVLGSLLTIVFVLIYSHLGITPLWIVITTNVVLFIGISSRIISSSALMTSIPNNQDRGAFMSINSAVQQTSGGIGATIAGMIVVKNSNGQILHYDTLGYIVNFAMLGAVVMMYFVNRNLQKEESKKINSSIELELVNV